MRPSDESPEEQDWYRFQQIRWLDNHWQRPGWADRRRSYHWFLTFEHACGLRALTARCQEPFRDLSQFDLVPLDSLHLTIQRVAFTDELPASRLPAVVAAVRQRCANLAPFRLQIGWLAGSTGAVRFTALPLDPVLDLRAATVMRDTTVKVAGHPFPCAAEHFWPHVSIAYSNAVQPSAAIAAMIDALRSLPPAEVLIASVALVELRREGRAYRWDELDRIELGG